MPTFLNQEPRETSFRKLYEDYYAPFCLYAKRYIEDGEVRQDIVSEVFAQTLEQTRCV